MAKPSAREWERKREKEINLIQWKILIANILQLQFFLTSSSSSHSHIALLIFIFLFIFGSFFFTCRMQWSNCTKKEKKRKKNEHAINKFILNVFNLIFINNLIKHYRLFLCVCVHVRESVWVLMSLAMCTRVLSLSLRADDYFNLEHCKLHCRKKISENSLVKIIGKIFLRISYVNGNIKFWKINNDNKKN